MLNTARLIAHARDKKRVSYPNRTPNTQEGAQIYQENKRSAEEHSQLPTEEQTLPVDEISNHAETEKIIRVTSPTEQTQKQEAETQPQQKPAQREKAPVIDFGRLAEKGYLSEQRSNNPGENMPDPTAKSEEPPVRRGKDLLYSKARERNPEELTEQAPIKEPVQETKAPNYDDMWANASDDDKAAFAEFMAQRNK